LAITVTIGFARKILLCRVGQLLLLRATEIYVISSTV